MNGLRKMSNKSDDMKWMDFRKMSNKLDGVKRKHIAKRNVIKTYLSVEQNINFPFRLTSFGMSPCFNFLINIYQLRQS